MQLGNLVRALVLILAGLVFATPSAWSAEATLNGVRFTLPDNWQRQDKSGIMLQQTLEKDEAGTRDKRGGALIQILPAANGGTFDANYQTALKIFPDLLDERPISKKSGQTANGHAIRMEHRCCARRQGVKIATTTVGIAGPHLQQFIVLVEMNLSGDDSRAAEATFAEVVRSVRLSSDDKPFALTPPEGSGGLDGVYTTLHTGIMPNAFGGTDFTSEMQVLALDPSGLFSRSIPSTTIADHCTQTPTDCGTYALKGGGLFANPTTITMNEVANAYGIIETSDVPFRKTGDGLEIDEASYNPVPPLSTDKRFDGTWRFFFASSGSMAGSSGGVSSERLLTMKPDGTFTRSGSSGFMSSVDGGTGTTGIAGSSQRPIEAGTYAVEGYHLMLSGTDGRTERLSLFMPSADDEDLLVIDGSNYLRRKD